MEATASGQGSEWNNLGGLVFGSLACGDFCKRATGRRHLQHHLAGASQHLGSSIYHLHLHSWFFFPLLVICMCYLLIVIKIRSSGKKVHATSTKRRKSERKVTRMVVIVVAVFVFCWMPFYALNIINLVESLRDEPQGLHLFVVVLSYANSCANPLFTASFRRTSSGDFERLCAAHLEGSRTTSPPSSSIKRNEEERWSPGKALEEQWKMKRMRKKKKSTGRKWRRWRKFVGLLRTEMEADNLKVPERFS